MDMSGKKVISIVTNCWNEVENIPLFYQRCRAELDKFPEYDYEFVVEDNYSTDGTRDVLRKIAAEDKKFKVIFNANNFGHIRSPFNCLLSSSGDVVFYLCSDLQEPPEMLSEFMQKYHEGYRVVCGVGERKFGLHTNVVEPVFKHASAAGIEPSAVVGGHVSKHEEHSIAKRVAEQGRKDIVRQSRGGGIGLAGGKKF